MFNINHYIRLKLSSMIKYFGGFILSFLIFHGTFFQSHLAAQTTACCSNYAEEECDSGCLSKNAGYIIGGVAAVAAIGAAVAITNNHSNHGKRGGTGPSGASGASGASGHTGIPGPLGPMGPMGLQGLPGPGLTIPLGPNALTFTFSVVTTDISLPTLNASIIGFVTLPTGEIITTPAMPLTTTVIAENIFIPAPVPVGVYTATFFVDEINRGTPSQFGTLIITEAGTPHVALYNVSGAAGTVGQQFPFDYTYNPALPP
jgi:hypothetical protein